MFVNSQIKTFKQYFLQKNDVYAKSWNSYVYVTNVNWVQLNNILFVVVFSFLVRAFVIGGHRSGVCAGWHGGRGPETKNSAGIN